MAQQGIELAPFELSVWAIPTALFAYKPADDVLHIVLGLLLVGVGLFADRKPSPPAATGA